MAINEPLRSGRPRIIYSERGAFDLPSILVVVLVVAVMALGVMAIVFGIIPFAQDKAAEQDLAAINTAQGVAKTKEGGYLSASGLTTANLLSSVPPAVSVEINSDSSSFCASAVSPTGKSFRLTASQATPIEGDCNPLWARQNSLPTPSYWFGAAASSDGNTLLSFNNSGGGFRMSKDAGLAWTAPAFSASKVVRGAAVSGNGKVMLVGTAYGTTYSLYLSTDAGSTWAAQPFDIAPATGGTMGYLSIATSTDGRTSLIALGDGTWRISRDFGATWSATGPAPIDVITKSVSVSDDGMKLAIADKSRQWISPDGGITWTQIGTSTLVSRLIFSGDGNHLYQVNASNLNISDDGGATWRSALRTTESALAVSASTNGQSVIAASTMGYVRISKDGGVTWKDQPSAKVNRWVSAAVSGNGNVLVAGEYGGGLWVAQPGW